MKKTRIKVPARESERAVRSAAKGAAMTAAVPREAIERRAYELYLSRGCAGGSAVDDWLEAERELLQKV